MFDEINFIFSNKNYTPRQLGLVKQISNIDDNSKKNLVVYFLAKAATPIYNTLFFKSRLLKLLREDYIYSKIKLFCNKNKVDNINTIINAVKSFDASNINDLFSVCKVDLSFVETIVRVYLEDFKIDLKSNRNLEERKRYYECQYYYNIYKEVKYLVSSLYYRLVKAYIIFYYKTRNSEISTCCLLNNLIIGIDRALNKYTPGKGPLTSYVKMWFKSMVLTPIFEFEDRLPFNHSQMKDVYKYSKDKIINVIDDDDDNIFERLESGAESLVKQQDFSNINSELLNIINNIEDDSLDLVKIILNIPKTVS